MWIQRQEIVGRARQSPLLPVGLDDFELIPGGTIAPERLWLDPLISLYSLDQKNRQAIFVETPPTVDLSQAPFLYQAQFEQAQQVYLVPYEMFFRLAETHTNRGDALIFIHSTGRCGSTLLSSIFNQIPDVVSLSEPDVYTLLVSLRNVERVPELEISNLLAACTRFLCKSTPGKLAPARWAIKFRSMCLELGDLLYAQFPLAKTLFLYRNAETWARSNVNAFRLLDPELSTLLAAFINDFPKMMPLMADYAPPVGAAHPVSILTATLWLSIMQRHSDLVARGVPICALRYEDLQLAPQKILTAAFQHCGLGDVQLDLLLSPLSQDSQQGTSISQEQTRQNAYHLTAAHLAEIRMILQRHSSIQTADFIAPGTVLP